MKKSLISRLFTLVVMVAFMASCTEKSSEYTNVIPADANVVVGVRIQSLIDKSGVSDADKQKLIDMMKGELSANAFEQVEKMIKDGSASGLSVKEPVYFFTSDLLSSVGVVMKMDNMEKFRKALDTMLPELSESSVTEVNGYNQFQFNNGICAFNESTLLIIEAKKDEKIMADLMKQTKSESIAQSANFTSMADKKGDITFFFTADAIPQSFQQQGITFGDVKGVDPKDIAIIGGLSFEKGKIALRVEIASENAEYKKFVKQQEEISGKLNNRFLANFPVSTLVYAAVNVDGTKLYETLSTESGNFRKSFPADQMELVKAVFDAFKGDASFALTDVSMSDATFTAYAEATSGAALEALYASKSNLGLSRSEDITKLGENEYVLKSNQMNIFFGYKDNYMYMTSNEGVYKNMGKKEDKSLKDAVYASNMKGKKQYMVIDVKAILDLPVVKMLSAMGGREVATYMDMASNISYMEAMGEDNNSVVNIWLTDEDTNSLKQIVDLAKQYAGVQ